MHRTWIEAARWVPPLPRDQPLRLVYAGSLAYDRSLHSILAAIGLLRQEFPPDKLQLTYAGPHGAELRQASDVGAGDEGAHPARGVGLGRVRPGIAEAAEPQQLRAHEDQVAVLGGVEGRLNSGAIGAGHQQVRREASAGSATAGEASRCSWQPTQPRRSPGCK